MVLIDILFQLVPHHLVILLIISVGGALLIVWLSTLLFGFTTEINIFKVTALLN
jgi:hypothetical protein